MLSIIATALVPAFFVMGLGYFAGKEKIVDALHVQSLNACHERGITSCGFEVAQVLRGHLAAFACQFQPPVLVNSTLHGFGQIKRFKGF
jgi:hypothetical protein